jgi:hypothetical protein
MDLVGTSRFWAGSVAYRNFPNSRVRGESFIDNSIEYERAIV